MPNSVVWFDIPVTNLDRATQFYAAVLGRPVTKHEGPDFAIAVLDHTGDEVGGCLVVATSARPSDQGPLLYLNAQGRLDEAVIAATANGGQVLKARHSSAPHGFCAIVLDSEGNRVALHSM